MCRKWYARTKPFTSCSTHRQAIRYWHKPPNLTGRFLRRVMSDVLRHAEPPHEIWDQHEVIIEAALDGDDQRCGELMRAHATRAARLLADNSPETTGSEPQ